MNKVVSPDHWVFSHSYYRDRAHYRFIFTNGCFDCLGPHHVKLLQFAKSLREIRKDGFGREQFYEDGDPISNDFLVVGVNTDEGVKRLKGEGRPIMSLEDRSLMLSALECVDFVIPFDEDTPCELIKKIKPWKIVKGGDYNAKDVVGVDVVGEENVVIFPTVEGCSTTKLIEKLRSLP